jgi:shikimate kinase
MPANPSVNFIQKHLGKRNIVLVGMMGAGKSTVGRRLATLLELPFYDADQEIEAAAQMSVEEIFSLYGEAEFRRGEQEVILRLLDEHSPQVLATGGGAFMNEDLRKAIARTSLSVWLKADFDVLMERVRKRSNRPLLQQPDPESIMRRLIKERYPVYHEAMMIVQSHDASHDVVVRQIVKKLADHLAGKLE